MTTLDPESLKYVVGALGAAATTILGAVAVLLRKSYQLGQISERISETTVEIREAKHAIDRASEKLAAIPVHEQRIGQIENALGRMTSDVRDLLRAVARMEGREQARSSPDWSNGNGGPAD